MNRSVTVRLDRTRGGGSFASWAIPKMTVGLMCLGLLATVLAPAAMAMPGPPVIDGQPIRAVADPEIIAPDSWRQQRPPISSGRVDGLLSLPPPVLYAGTVANIPVSLFSGERAARGRVQVTLSKAGVAQATTSALLGGTGIVNLNVPAVPPGLYQLAVNHGSVGESRDVKVESDLLLLIETDKPMYKPGQQVRIRALRLDSLLKPRPGPVTTEVMDANGNKVFRKELQSDDFGILNLSVPLSTEPVLGIWTVTATSEGRTAAAEVRVERYADPVFGVEVAAIKDWVLADEQIIGIVRAKFSFGKPVQGNAEIVASRNYFGEWREIARTSIGLDGVGVFTLPAPGPVRNRGDPRVLLDVSLRQASTGHVEHASHLITIEPAPEIVRLLPESRSFKPALPLTVLALTESPGGLPLDRRLGISVSYLGPDLSILYAEERRIHTRGGQALVVITPPPGSVALTLQARTESTSAALSLRASHSPSNNFVSLHQIDPGDLASGARARFRADSTDPNKNFHYLVVARGQVVLADVSASPAISFAVTPAMSPASNLVVYQLLANGEIAADYLPFDVAPGFPLETALTHGGQPVRPGEAVELGLATDGPARVALVAVDSSVAALAEDRLNLDQLVAELDRRSTRPVPKLYESRPLALTTAGPKDVFLEAGVIPVSNLLIETGPDHTRPPDPSPRGGVTETVASAPSSVAATTPASPRPAPELAPVPRLRQHFPETWLWSFLDTDITGQATVNSIAPDRITTWDLSMIALSKEHGLGISRASLRVLQPFFVKVDLPHAAVRGDEFSIEVALHNYLDEEQTIAVDLASAPGFEFRNGHAKSVTVAAGDVAHVEFDISVSGLGQLPIHVSARSPQAADAVLRQLLVEPEGIRQEWLENAVLKEGAALEIESGPPAGAVPGSARTRVAFTANHLGPALDSRLAVEGLLELPAGCGEQNLALFAADVYAASYLEATGPPDPEVADRIEEILQVGYQSQLAFRHSDGSYSVWGRSDPAGELWITAFALKTLAEAERHVYVDQSVIDRAADWIVARQQPDGSFGSPGFVHHRQLLAGTDGQPALTAFVASALHAAGRSAEFASAVNFLEAKLAEINNPYAVAITAYVLELADSAQAPAVNAKLLSIAQSGPNGLSWGQEGTIAIETTAYAALALFERGALTDAAEAGRWLSSQRNAFGGFGSTQDTVVALKALAQYSILVPSQAEMTISLAAGDWARQITVDASNADLLQVVEVPAGDPLMISGSGSGEVLVQVARRFNVLEPESDSTGAFTVEMALSGAEFAVGETMSVAVEVGFAPPENLNAGMVVLEVQLPNGYALVQTSAEELVNTNPAVRRYGASGRTAFFYVDDFEPGQVIDIGFEVRAVRVAPVQAARAQAYAYYMPDWRGQTVGPMVAITPE